MIDMALSFQEADGCAQIWYVSLFYKSDPLIVLGADHGQRADTSSKEIRQ